MFDFVKRQRAAKQETKATWQEAQATSKRGFCPPQLDPPEVSASNSLPATDEAGQGRDEQAELVDDQDGRAETMVDASDATDGASVGDAAVRELWEETADQTVEDDPSEPGFEVVNPPALSPPRRRTKRLAKPQPAGKTIYTPQQRLLLLDTWRRSGLPAKDFAALVGMSKHTLYKWKQAFEQHGPEGLMDQPRGTRRGSRLPEVTRRAILMMKESHPEWGCQRISDMLARGPALSASASAVARVLHEAGYECELQPTRPHPQKPRRFERAKVNQLWQTDLFTFVLKRQNRRVYLVAFMDDHSRFLVSYGLTASASTAFVIEVLEAGIASYGRPEEILTDNGPQYTTWRGKSRFTRQLEKRGIRQIIARPKRPQTLGKIERFWGTMWREFLETAVFTDLADARRRIGLFIDHYNFMRVHRGISESGVKGGCVPADRFFQAAPQVLQTLKEQVDANALEAARQGERPKPFYVTGQMDGQSFSVHREGERLVLQREGQPREQIELAGPREQEAEPLEAETPDTAAESRAAGHFPVTPDGSPGELPDEPADVEPPLPGESAIDALLADLVRDDSIRLETRHDADGRSQEGGAQ